ncbi:ubiquitin-like domain-containing protein, partial [Streptomyces sp. GC420]|uniref:ubiquitin-like domain-containing protein n=1 Tax=Streptomyces sp. GC420 TaxID=2697568 RepID=UPI0014151AB0
PVPPPRPAPGGGRAEARRAARRRATRRPEAVRRLLPFLPRALVVALLAGGTSAFVAEDKAVELSVDGRPRTLHTFADDVAELLAAEGIETGSHDLVTPAPGTALDSGTEVVVRYGRPLVLTVDDGERRRLWTTARTVEGALRQLGVRAEGAYVSLPRSSRIGRAGATLDVRTARTVTFVADGRAHTVRTSAATVREAVEQAGIELRGRDTTSVPPGSFPRDGQTITVLRIADVREIREELIPFAVRRIPDPGLFRGVEILDRAGQQGARRVTYAVLTVNGVRQRPRRLGSEVVRQPVEQLVRFGTRPLPVPAAGGGGGLDWRGLALCGPGGGRVQDLTAAGQTLGEKRLYVLRGALPWPHCGRAHGR